MDIELIIHSHDPDALTQLRAATRALRKESHNVTGRVTFESGDAERFAREAVTRGADLVLAAGGDGTLNEVANGLATAEGVEPGGTTPALGIIPLGTANDFANWVGVPLDPIEAVRAAVEAEPRVIDLAQVNDRYFLNVSTGGFGAAATEEAPERAKRTLGVLAYVITGLRKFASLEPCNARFTSAGEVIYEGDFMLFAVGNGQQTGGGNFLTPNSSLHDGLLDFCLVKSLTHAEFLRLAPDLRSGAHIDSEHVLYLQLPELRIESEHQLSANADGEPIPARSFTYKAAPRSLRLALPAHRIT
jgi:lipid kinase YegS